MLLLPEGVVPQLVSTEDAIASVEQTFVAFDRGEAAPYPVVRETLGHRGAVFGVKSGFDRSAGVLGLKAGGYWPENAAAGLTNHQSTVLLFDPDTGKPIALVGGNYLTGVRTGAASAIATRHLARRDARVLGLIGAGVQSAHQIRAALAVRPLATVVAWDPSAANLAELGRIVLSLGVDYRAAGSAEEAVRAADILTTVTPATRPIVMKDWVRPGTHINAMGADTRGKQELAAELVAASRVIVDDTAQAITIGECQHAYAQGMLRTDAMTTLGSIAGGRCPGRQSDSEITLFDGTGIALQDLAPAATAVRRARERGLGVEVPF
ncbi:MAG TPA: ornithine cyclodeaminase family protein [Casimicrobiaceae bacterium]|nr:ornithine cyclodeaminase family protein [Casimicrobiaceae bacterium]